MRPVAKKDRASEPARDQAITLHLCQRLRQMRRQRHWSLDQLAQASGVSRSMLSQIERNLANPTLAVAFRIARAFGISLGELVDAEGGGQGIDVIRAGDETFTYRSDKDCTVRTLSPLHLEKDVELYEVRLRAGGVLNSAAHFQGTREFLAVQRGAILVKSGSCQEALSEGDSASYRADVPHAIINHGRREAVVFLVDIYA